MAPVHELRRVADGTLVCKLEEADISALKASGWEPPEVFVAKGRDGKTDIWGIICRPKNFDPAQEVPGHRADLRRPAGLVRPQDVQPQPAVRVADRPRLHRRPDRRHGDGQPLQGVPRRLLEEPQGRRLPRPHPLASRPPPTKYPVVRPRPASASTAARPAARTRRAACCSTPSSTRSPSPTAAATTIAWTRPRGTSSGWATRSARSTPSRSNIDNAHRLQGQAAADRRRAGHERPARIDDAAGRRPDQGRQGLRAARRPRRQPRHGRRLRPAADAATSSSGTCWQRAARTERRRRRVDGPQPSVDGDRPTSRPGPLEPGASTWATSPTIGSELRGVIERYEADRRQPAPIGSPPAGSPQRDERIREFTAQWLDQLGRLDFDRLEPRRPGRLPPLQEPPRPRADVSSTSGERSAPRRRRWSRSRRRSSTSTTRGAS